MDEKLYEAIDKTDAVLRRAWERDVAPAEKVRSYSVGFECTESVAARIMAYIAEQPTWRRSYRSYEVGSVRSEDG